MSNALNNALNGAYAIGEERLFPFVPSDSRWIQRDGSVISQADYPALFSVYYCGDILNGTADFGYRCTNPVDPSNTRDIAGTYVVLENANRRFDRSVVPGGSRELWSYEEDQLQGHRHELTTAGGDALQFSNFVGDAGTASQGYRTVGSSNDFARTIRIDGAYGTPRVGNETRPKNSAKVPMIFTGVAA